MNLVRSGVGHVEAGDNEGGASELLEPLGFRHVVPEAAVDAFAREPHGGSHVHWKRSAGEAPSYARAISPRLRRRLSPWPSR
jgi:hypothetical protein